MKPASTMKLLTTAAAFEHLPALFQTKIWAHQTDAGTVLRWVGVGDPMMGDPGPLDDSRIPSTLLSQLATEIRRAGITDVVRLEYDEGHFQGPRYHPNWPEEQFSKSYRCESAALNFSGNLIRMELHPKATRPNLELFPSEAIQIVTVREQFRDLKTTTKKDAVGFDRYPGRNEFRAFGVCRNHHVLESPVHDPARWAAELLATTLRMDGISVLQVDAIGPEDGPPKGKPIASATINTPLFRVIKHCNTESRNLYAECLLKSLDRHLGGDGTWLASGADRKTAGERLLATLSILFPGSTSAGDVIDDGSGLSHNNRLTARTLAQILTKASTRDWHQEWLETLAKGRESGTLANRFRSKSFDHCLVRGKSGYISGASTLAGRIDQDDGQHLTFAIMVKDFKSNTDAKRLHEAILAEAVREMPRLSQGDERVPSLAPSERPFAIERGEINANSSDRLVALPLCQPETSIRPLKHSGQSASQKKSTLFLSGTGVLLILLGLRLS
jgi:D-alanyl-D-alanine carboxypeptidase/D-alanyl-D-alanine-endopeptidase (penicillin-binding protein 4)